MRQFIITAQFLKFEVKAKSPTIAKIYFAQLGMGEIKSITEVTHINNLLNTIKF